jgi:hypothetical protein
MSFSIYRRKESDEQPYWPFGPFKIRLPLIHYRWEMVEFIQAMILFVVSLPLVSFFKPVLSIGLSLTLVVTGYLCIVAAPKSGP